MRKLILLALLMLLPTVALAQDNNGEDPNWRAFIDQSADPSAMEVNKKIVFTGSGLNDFSSSVAGYNKISIAVFTITLSATGTPDKFDWTEAGGSGSSAAGVNITGAAQTLADGATITFAATTGHHLNDVWTVTATPQARLFMATTGAPTAIWPSGSTTVMATTADAAMLSADNVFTGKNTFTKDAIFSGSGVFSNSNLSGLGTFGVGLETSGAGTQLSASLALHGNFFDGVSNHGFWWHVYSDASAGHGNIYFDGSSDNNSYITQFTFSDVGDFTAAGAVNGRTGVFTATADADIPLEAIGTATATGDLFRVYRDNTQVGGIDCFGGYIGNYNNSNKFTVITAAAETLSILYASAWADLNDGGEQLTRVGTTGYSVITGASSALTRHAINTASFQVMDSTLAAITAPSADTLAEFRPKASSTKTIAARLTNGAFVQNADAVTLSAGATTIDATIADDIDVTGDAGTNTIGTISGAQPGRTIRLHFNDALITITHGASVELAGNADFTSAARKTLVLTCFTGTTWSQTGGSSN